MAVTGQRGGMERAAFAAPAGLSLRAGGKRVCARRAVRCAAAPPPMGDGSQDGPGGKEGSGYSVDWDEDWNQFKSSGARATVPGRQPPTPQEKAVAKARLQAQMVRESMPTRQAVLADWRFWVALLLTLSVITAFVGSAGQPAVGTGLPTV